MSSESPSPLPPVYFLSHGGPPIIDWTHHPAHAAFQTFGKDVISLQPKGIVVFSAHFEGKHDEIHINQAESADLIYDFYGNPARFPKHYYQKKFPHKGSAVLASTISGLLASSGIKSRFVSRGLDHGVWIPFLIAFGDSAALQIPIVQVSIYDNEDAAGHLALGKAIAPLRQSGYVIVASGQAVHNLRQLSFSADNILPFVEPFDKALEAAMTSNTGPKREEEMLNLLRRKDARGAHPTFDHILPIYVAIGAASDALGEQTFNHYEGSLGWAQYRLNGG